MKFLDQAKIFVKAGGGGSGSASFRREKFVEFGGPDGGDGGNGGSVILIASKNLNTLIDFRYQQHFKAEKGQDGKGQKKTGRSGKNLILKVPVGTQVFEEDNNTLIEDLLKSEQKIVVANGGKGGLGNVRFRSSVNRAPRKKTDGDKGESFWIWLQLKVIADIGIIGLPNSGKSSLLSVLTSAKPKIANYPFTTINPNLGVAIYNNKEITLADIPGLIEGAHEGIGLGDKFLRHIERCKTLLHLIDILSLVDMTKEMKKYLISLMIVLALSACATLPPLQEMSNARQTIAAAKEMNPMTEQSEKIQEAERLLSRAERRMEVNLYESARQDALRAQKEAIEFIEWAISQSNDRKQDD